MTQQPYSPTSRNRAAWPLLAVLLLGTLFFPTPLPAQPAGEGEEKLYNPADSKLEKGAFTADELLNQGLTAYRAQRWEDALNAFGAFLRDYGDAREAAGAITRVRPLIAMSLVQLKRWGEALQAIEEVFPLEKEIDPGTLELIYFWKGACQFFLEEYGPARESLNTFAEKFPQSQKFTEALLLTATSYVLEADYQGAVNFCKRAEGVLKGPERSQIIILHLYSLLEIPQLDEAYALVTSEFERLDDMVQLAAFQTMTLKLGSLFLVEKKYHSAIGCLQRLWPLERILAKQDERLAVLKGRLAVAEARRDDPFIIHKLNQLISKIERELKNFQKIEHWDSASRLRVATAYIELERYREAALILDEMLRKMPPDPIVEQASLNLIRLWMLIESWDRAEAASALFQTKFPQSQHLPLAMFLRGQSLQFERRYSDALDEFERLVDKHPKSEYAPRGEFMIGFTLVMTEDYELAIETLEALPEEFPQSDILPNALYWRGMTHSMAKRHEVALGLMDEYLKKHPKGEEAAEAEFRRAYSLHGLKRYEEGIAAFRKFLKAHPSSDRKGEALLLAGDAHLALGQVDEGYQAYRDIPESDVQFFEEGWFKIGRAYRMQDRLVDLELHMREFTQRAQDSPRVAEAVYWLGWAQRQQGHEDKAREIYWETLRQYGNNPRVPSVEELFEGLGKLYTSSDALPELLRELEKMSEEAERREQEVLAMRSLWGRAQLLRKRQPEVARSLMMKAADYADFETSSSRVLTDIAETFMEVENVPRAMEFFRETLRWNPRAIQKDRLFAGLADLARRRGDLDEALKYYQRFSEETYSSIRLGDILAAKADVELELGRKEEARQTLETMLAEKSIKGRLKAETLLKLGDLHRGQREPKVASAYYERVYVLYGRWSDLVAQAYYRRGEALEDAGEKKSAAETYNELAKRVDLAELEPAIAARQKLASLREYLPPEPAEPAPTVAAP